MSTSVDVVLLAMSMMLASSLTFIPMHILHLIISLISLASSATLALPSTPPLLIGEANC